MNLGKVTQNNIAMNRTLLSSMTEAQKSGRLPYHVYSKDAKERGHYSKHI